MSFIMITAKSSVGAGATNATAVPDRHHGITDETDKTVLASHKTDVIGSITWLRGFLDDSTIVVRREVHHHQTERMF